MLKLKNSAMLVVAGLCGYLALMTPDWKAQLSAMSGLGYLPNNDYNSGPGNHVSDVLMRNTSTGAYQLNTMANYVVSTTTSISLPTSSDYTYAATLRINDGSGDVGVLTRRTSDGGWHFSRVDQGVVITEYDLTGIYTAQPWNFALAGDFNGDGDDDILLRSTGAGGNGAWQMFIMQNGQVVSNNYYNAYLSLDYVPIAAADLDADGDDDVIERQASNGAYGVFETQNGSVVRARSLGQIWANASYTYQFAADLNNDGFDDIVIRNTGSGGTGYWYKFQFGVNTSTTPKQRFYVPAGGQYLDIYHDINMITFGAVGDYNGDGTADVITHDSRNYWWLAKIDSSGNVISAQTNQLFAGLTNDPAWVIQQQKGN